MKNTGIPALSATVLFALILASCDGTYNPHWNDYDMRGAWECTVEAFWPEDQPWGQPWTKEKGRIVLDYDTITIIGPVAHLKDFTRKIPLEAYTVEDAENAEDSETGLLYIYDRGVLQSPVSYRRWQSGGYPKVEMLTLTGGGIDDETLQKMPD